MLCGGNEVDNDGATESSVKCIINVENGTNNYIYTQYKITTI